MPWCPNCRTEYRAGVRACADCGAALVDELEEIKERAELCYMKNEEAIMKLKDYLSYTGIQSEAEFIPEEDAYVILVAEEDLKKAKVEYKAFLTVEASSHAPQEAFQAAPGDEEIEEELDEPLDLDNPEDIKKLKNAGVTEREVQEQYMQAMKAAAYKPAGVYESQADKANEFSSTGYTFTIVGVAMLIFSALNCFNVIGLFYGNIMVLCVLFALSLASIGVGLSSFKRAKKASAKSVEEERFTEEFNKWLEAHAYIMTQGHLDGSDGTAEELLYLERTEAMKKAIESCFGPLDEDYVDSKLDDFYNRYFGE